MAPEGLGPLQAIKPCRIGPANRQVHGTVPSHWLIRDLLPAGCSAQGRTCIKCHRGRALRPRDHQLIATVSDRERRLEIAGQEIRCGQGRQIER